MGLWLKEIPDNTEIFVRLAIVSTLIASLSAPLVTAQNATGNVRNYQLVVGCVLLLNLPMSYVGLKIGLPAESVFVVAIIVEILCLIARVIMVPLTIKEFNPLVFIKQVVFNFILVCSLSLPLPLLFHELFHYENFISFIISSIISVSSVLVIVYFVGCNHEERTMIKHKMDVVYNNFSLFLKK